jgi:hypothetical protein
MTKLHERTAAPETAIKVIETLCLPKLIAGRFRLRASSSDRRSDVFFRYFQQLSSANPVGSGLNRAIRSQTSLGVGDVDCRCDEWRSPAAMAARVNCQSAAQRRPPSRRCTRSFSKPVEAQKRKLFAFCSESPVTATLRMIFGEFRARLRFRQLKQLNMRAARIRVRRQTAVRLRQEATATGAATPATAWPSRPPAQTGDQHG